MFEILVTAFGLTVNGSHTMYMEPAPEDFKGIPIVFQDGRGLAPICPPSASGDGLDCDNRYIYVDLMAGDEYWFAIAEGDGIRHEFSWNYHPADVNMDGDVNFYDISYFIQSLYDYNRDGSIDYTDMYDLLENYHLEV